MGDTPKVLVIGPGRSSAFASILFAAFTGLAASPLRGRRDSSGMYDDPPVAPPPVEKPLLVHPPISHARKPLKHDTEGLERARAAEAKRQRKAEKKAENIRKAEAGKRKR